MNIKAIFSCFVGVSVLMLVGCGGGGGGGSTGPNNPYTGTTTPAAVTADNAEEVGTASTEAAVQAVADQENPFSIVSTNGSSVPLSSQQIRDIVRRIRDNLPQNDNLPIGITMTSDQLNAEIGETLFCGGSVTGPANMLTADSATLTFNDLCFDESVSGIGQIIVNGTLSYSYSENSAGSTDTTTYSDFSITFNGQTQTLNGTETCEEVYNPYSYSCSSTSNYVGSDGLTYQTQDVDVSGNSSSGYYVDATVYHPTYGYVTVTTDVAITFNCGNGMPDAGQVSYSGSGGSSGTITFDSCAGYTITYDDGNGVGGTFTGTW